MPDVMKTLLLNPPSFGISTAEQVRGGPRRARLSLLVPGVAHLSGRIDSGQPFA